MSSDNVTTRPAGKEHVPLYPKGFVALRILQLVFAVVCLGLTACLLTIVSFDAADLMIFTSVVAILTSIYLLVAHFGPAAAYNYWAILGLDIFHVIFWLIAFALMASRAAMFGVYSYYYDVATFSAIAAAAAGLGGVEWLLYLISLIMHGLALHRHRKAGLHALPNKAGSNTTTTPAAPNAVEVEDRAEKFQMQPQEPQQYQQYQQTQQTQQLQAYYPPAVNTPPPQQGYSPSPLTTAASPAYNQPTPPPQQIYEAPHAGIQPAEKVHEVA
ncbi:hypothetical protein F5Y17DRAFT_202169 [Xylariaceae sp. FL0594]|nr:hypothetical protein F5Y17DRAFT_202169 [Xylariaceae sp. FL0594]